MKRFFATFALIILFSFSLRAELPDRCPNDNCLNRFVANEDDGGRNSLRAAIAGACDDAGDDAIQILTRAAIELEESIVIPRGCNGRIFLFGDPAVRNVISGEDADVKDGNCLLEIESNENEVHDLSFIRFKNPGEDKEVLPGIGICLFGHRNLITNSSIGVLPNSNGENGNDVGIHILGSENRVIGNQISQNTFDGIGIEGDKNIIQNNYIGLNYPNCSFEKPKTDSTENRLVQNMNANSSQSTQASETSAETKPAESLVEEGAASSSSSSSPSPTGGCQLIIPSAAKEVKQTAQTSCPLISNGRYGIWIQKSASENIIGDSEVNIRDGIEVLRQTERGGGNHIVYNGRAGVRLDGTKESIRNRIIGNVFYKNWGLGIDLGKEGVTRNDLGDGDEGPNKLLNFPDHLQVITRVAWQQNRNIYSFFVDGKAPVGTLVEVYFVEGAGEEDLSAQGDESGYGEGETLFFRFIAASDPFEIELPNNIRRGVKATLLAMDPEGNTSEFSKNIILDQDSDFDGILDIFEDHDRNELVWDAESDPFNIDTDGDEMIDGVEDFNLDGLRDEAAGELSAILFDTDDDLLSDFIETKGDGKYDESEADSVPYFGDGDCDGLLDGDEDQNGNGVVEFYLGETDPRSPDSDGDGVSEGPGGCRQQPTPVDNCATLFNPEQADEDQNQIGDICERE